MNYRDLAREMHQAGIEDGVDGAHTVVAVVDVDGVTVVQPLKGTRDVDVEVKVVLVLSLVDSLEAADDIFMDVGGEWLRGLDLIVGGRVEGENPGGSGENLE